MADADTDLPTYLASKGLQVFKANGAEVTVHCPFCPDGDPKAKGKLYLNTETWLWGCKRCDTTGNRRSLLAHYGDSDTLAYVPGADPYARRQVLSEAASYAALMLTNNDAMMEYLIGRGLKARTIIDYRLGYVPRSTSLVESLPTRHHRADLLASGLVNDGGREFLMGKITIPYLSRGAVVTIRGKDPNGKYFTAAGDSVRLFNADRLAGAETVVVCEGEFDTLVLQQLLEASTDPKLRAIACVGIPGAAALPTGFENFFSEAKRVYLGFDPDDAGINAAIKVKGLLGSKARIVTLPTTLPKCDWTEWIAVRHNTVDDVVELLGTASGKRLWSVADAGAKWRRRSAETPGVATGYASLDAWFLPGLEAGDVVVPLAKTGVGKTNFLVNLAYNMRTVPVLFCSLEMMSGQVYERLRRVHHFYDPWATDAQVNEALKLLRIVDENRLREGDLTALADEYAEEMGFRPQVTMLDYLGYYAKGCKGNGSYEKTTNAVMSLKEEAKAGEVAIIAPHQVNRMAEDGKPLSSEDARDSGAVEETADLLLSLYRPADAIEGNSGMPDGTLRMQALKNRKGAKGQAANLMFSNASLVLVDSRTPAAAVCEEENRMMWRGGDYDEVRAFRRQRHGQVAQQTLRLA